MFRRILLVVAFVCTLTFSGCAAHPAEAPLTGINVGVHATPDGTAVDYRALFELKLYSDKAVYAAGERINAWATLRYTGSSDTVQITHGDPYILFQLTGGRFDAKHTSPSQASVGRITALKRGELLAFPFQKSGGYEPDKDADSAFWAQYFSTEGLTLPPGDYMIRAFGAFTMDQRDTGAQNNLIEELHIKVTK